ncbi:MAG: hypothetical protein JXA95_01150 [Spirochaetales bacterium]|nr:hypothetical protein [Spirochaetales bacterium]
MEENQDFLQLLEEKLRIKRADLESKVLPQLKDNLRVIGDTFHILYTYLVKKGFLKEDLYNYEQSTKLEPPSSDPIPDGEMLSELSFRLANYERVLDYMNNVWGIEIDKLDLTGIKKVLSVLDFIKWKSLGSNTTHNITRGLTMTLDKIITSNDDPMSSEVRFNSITKLNEANQKAKEFLKDISSYQREAYKFKIRALILTAVNPTEEEYNRNSRNILLSVKKEMNGVLPGEPYYRELIEEILLEDFAPDGQARREQLLKSIKTSVPPKKEVKSQKKEKKKVDKAFLLHIVPELAKAGDQLASATAKLEHNRDITAARKNSFLEVLRRLFNRKEEDIYYEVKTIDPVSGHERKIKLNYTSLIDKLHKKNQLLRSVGNTNSPAYGKLKEYSEKALMEFIENNLLDLRAFHKKMVGLDEMFKMEPDPTLRARVKGIRVEMDTLKRIYVESNKSLKEYVAQKEEQAQLKALGIEG